MVGRKLRVPWRTPRGGRKRFAGGLPFSLHAARLAKHGQMRGNVLRLRVRIDGHLRVRGRSADQIRGRAAIQQLHVCVAATLARVITQATAMQLEECVRTQRVAVSIWGGHSPKRRRCEVCCLRGLVGVERMLGQVQVREMVVGLDGEDGAAQPLPEGLFRVVDGTHARYRQLQLQVKGGWRGLYEWRDERAPLVDQERW